MELMPSFRNEVSQVHFVTLIVQQSFTNLFHNHRSTKNLVLISLGLQGKPVI